MFIVGRTYDISMTREAQEDDKLAGGHWTVAEFQPPLLKLTNPYSEDWIVNVGSRDFVGAKLQPIRTA